MMAQLYQSPEPAAAASAGASAALDGPSGASCVRVVGRVRPLLPTNEGNLFASDEEEARRCIRISSDSDVAVEGSHSSLYGVRHFRLNHVYGESASQEEVFESVIPLLSQFTSGYNCTIFMYGQTGSGKTHTMLGYDLWACAGAVEEVDGDSAFVRTPVLATEESSFGILPRAMMHLFNHLDLSVCTLTVSYLELYNDIKLYDLLRPLDAEPRSLDIRESRRGEILVPDLSEVQVNSLPEVLGVLWAGARVRKVAATDMNDYSSRSHTVFLLRTTRFDPQKQTIVSSKISFVDLAGSEKWRSSQLALMAPERVRELTSINRSLSALGNCVSALLQKNRSHVPYRDSKLTRLLQDSLGGNTLSLFVVTLSPSIENAEETLSTLQFADRAMKVQIVATKNEINIDSSASLKAEIRNLKALVCSLLKENIAPGCEIDIDLVLARAVANAAGFGDETNDSGVRSRGVSTEEEYLRLMDQYRCCQEQLQIALEENRSLLTILESNYKSDVAYNNCTSDGVALSLLAPPSEAEEFAAASPLGSASISVSPELRAQLLASRASELDRRERALAQVEAAQEERWVLLTDYHSWLQAQTRFLETDSMAADAAGVPVSDVYRRVQLMEGSVLVQADELRRAKALFVKTSTDLQRRLSQVTRENIELRRGRLASSHVQVIGDLSPKFSTHTHDVDDSPESLSHQTHLDDYAETVDHNDDSPKLARRENVSGTPGRITKPAVRPPSPPLSQPPKSYAKTNLRSSLPSTATRNKTDGKPSVASCRPKKDVVARSNQPSLPVTGRGVPESTEMKKPSRQERRPATESAAFSRLSSSRSSSSALRTPTPRMSEVSKAPASPSPMKHSPLESDSQLQDDDNDALIRAALAQAEEIFKRHAPVLQSQTQPRSETTVSGLCAAAKMTEEMQLFDWNEDDLAGSEVCAVQRQMQRETESTQPHTVKPNKRKGKKNKRLWELYVDAASGDTYYFNRETRATTWDRPPDDELEILWGGN